jgi:hypothetical protein
MEKILTIMMLFISTIATAQKERYFYITMTAQNGVSYGYSSVGRHFKQYPELQVLQRYGQCLLNFSGMASKPFTEDEILVGITEMKLADYDRFFTPRKYVNDRSFSFCDSTVLFNNPLNKSDGSK